MSTTHMEFPRGEGTKQPVNLGAIQETLLIPLYGRAKETWRKNGLLQDPKAVSIVERLDYDFARWDKTGSLIGACLRTLMMDEFVSEFLARHPSGTVVEIGCGLNTRFERIDNGKAIWFELDLPDSMALRQLYFEPAPRRHMLSASAVETGWMDEVKSTEGPWCFVSEAVLIYLDEPQVESVVRNLATRFPDAWLIMDTASRKMRDTQGTHDVMKTMSQDSWFRWGCDDPEAIKGWGADLAVTRDFMDASLELRHRLPFLLRFMMTVFPFVMRKKMLGYKLNRYVLHPPAEASATTQEHFA